MSNRRTYTIEKFIEAVEFSTSISEVLKILGLKEAGGNFESVKNRINKLKLDISHWKSISEKYGWSKGKVFPERHKPIENYLKYNFKIGTDCLKHKLFRSNIFERKCYGCGLTQWLNNPIPLELHHIDGNRLNNLLVNLTILCPNCHSLTENFRGKNIKIKNVSFSNYKYGEMSDYNKYRSNNILIRPQRRKAIRPSYEQLLKEIKETNYSAVGRKYGVSDNAIRKWVSQYEKANLPISPDVIDKLI